MAKLFIQDTTLTAIADAIRSKTGSAGGSEPVVNVVATNAYGFGATEFDASILPWYSTTSAASVTKPEDNEYSTWVYTGTTSSNGWQQNYYTTTVIGASSLKIKISMPSDGRTVKAWAGAKSDEAGTYIIDKAYNVSIENAEYECSGDTVTFYIRIYNDSASKARYSFYIEVTGYDADGNQIMKATEGEANTTQYKPTEMPAAILSISGEGGGGITPTGELEITENGSYDVTTYASAQVTVPVGVFPTGTLPITQNGEYSVESYASVLVDVASSGGSELEPVVLTGSCDYACAGALANGVIPQMGGKITTNNIYQAPYMFYNTGLDKIPFELNFYPNYDMTEVNSMFQNASNLKTFPTIKNLNPKNASQMFAYCHELTNIPEGATSTWSFNKWHTSTAAQAQHVFRGCYRLRHIDSNLLRNLWNCNTLYLYNLYYYLFSECYALDEVRNLGVSTATLTGNAFNQTFYECSHLKNFTFVSGKSASWSNQVIDLTTVGFFPGWGIRSEDFTLDLKVADLASYEALKDNPDWWTADVAFSRYNHDSAVSTINSLPTITASGATNTIKFNGAMGSGYGKAISDLTDTEIAVATSKGWTVSIT